MVTVGFLVEGHSEAILIKSESFLLYLKSLGVRCEPDLVTNAIGKFNLYHPSGDFTKLRERVFGWLQSLEDKGAQKIFILLDMDNDDGSYCVFKSKVCKRPMDIIIVAKQELEAWYLADTPTLAKFLDAEIEEVKNPETFQKPLEEIIRQNIIHNKRGISDKKILTRNMIQSGFSLAAAALHPNCPSAKYFNNKLIEIANS